MKSLNSKVSTTGIFFAASTIFLVFLFTIRYDIPLPAILFWLAVILMLSTILYQCFRLELSSDYVKIILLEIVITCIVFHLAEQIPFYGLSDSDAYIDLASAKSIWFSGFIRGDPAFVNATSYYPMIHILGVQLSSISNVDLITVAKWFPSILDVAFILLIYLFIRSIFKEERIALLSALLLACLQVHILFGSLFVRQTIALVLFISCLYFYLSSRSAKNPAIYIALSIICLVGTIMAHHFTSFMLVLFILLHFLVMKITRFSYIRKTYLNLETIGERIGVSFVLIALVSLFSYWIFVVKISPPHILLYSDVKTLFDIGIWGKVTYSDVVGITTVMPTLRSNILFWGFNLMFLFFGIILIYGLLPRLKGNRIEALSFTLFLFFCGIMALIELYVLPHGMGIFPDRFLVFGWLFGFAPLIFLILYRMNNVLRQIVVFLLMSFMLLNIYAMDSSLWDPQSTDIPSATTEEDYALANTLDFYKDRIAGHSYALYAIYDVHNNLNRSINFIDGTDLSAYDWIVSHKESLRQALLYLPTYETANELWGLLNGESTDWIKAYESSNLTVLKHSLEESGVFIDHIERARVYNGTGPIINVGNSLDWNEHIREIGNVLYESTDTEKKYKTFYSGYKGSYEENNVYIGFAYSADGNSWTDYGKIIHHALEDPYVIRVNNTYFLYAEDKADVPFRNIRRYHSKDCINWIDDGIVLEPEASGWDSQDVSSPIVWREFDKWYMFYEGRNIGADGKIGLAISPDGLNWSKSSSNPVFSGSGTREDFDRYQVVPDDMIKIGSTYYLIYHGYNNYSSWSTGIAYSRDMFSWIRVKVPISSSSTVMVYYDGTYYVAHYCIDDSSGIYTGYLR